MYKASKVKYVFGIVAKALSYVFFVVCLLVLALVIMMKKDDGAANLFGRQLRIVESNSMESCEQTDVSGYKIKDIPVKSLVVIELVPSDAQKAQAWYGELKKGDVLTFRYFYARQETITHRLVENPVAIEGGYLLYLEGDNKNSDGATLTQTIDTSLTDSPNYVVGKVTSTHYAAGAALVALKSRVGIICLIILPTLLIMGIELYSLGVNVGKERRKQLENIARAQSEEIEELRARLEGVQRQLSQKKQPKTEVGGFIIEYDEIEYDDD